MTLSITRWWEIKLPLITKMLRHPVLCKTRPRAVHRLLIAYARVKVIGNRLMMRSTLRILMC